VVRDALVLQAPARPAYEEATPINRTSQYKTTLYGATLIDVDMNGYIF